MELDLDEFTHPLVRAALTYNGYPSTGRAGHNGGNTSEGFHCSGLLERTLLDLNQDLNSPEGPMKKSSHFYTYLGEPVEEPSEGDMAFFTKNGEHATHVGIYLGEFDGEQWMFHSPGTYSSKKARAIVRPTTIDKYLRLRRNRNPQAELMGFKRIEL